MPGVLNGDQEDHQRQEGDFRMIEGTLEEQWDYWNSQAEAKLMRYSGKEKGKGGRGRVCDRVRNTVSVKQVGDDCIGAGSALQEAVRSANRALRLQFLRRIDRKGHERDKLENLFKGKDLSKEIVQHRFPLMKAIRGSGRGGPSHGFFGIKRTGTGIRKPSIGGSLGRAKPPRSSPWKEDL